VSLRRLYLITCAENQQSNLEKQQSALFFNVRFCLKKLPVTHVRQATIFAGQTVKFYRSATGNRRNRHLFRGLASRTGQEKRIFFLGAQPGDKNFL
jgi:hypothetical protein